VISYIVPAYNEERLLGRTLIALREAARLAVEPFEMIVVDDGSTDRTPQIAASHGARVVAVRHRHIAAARNAGARAARGGKLVFIDADTRVSAPVLRAAIAAMERGVAGGGCHVDFDGPLPLYARLMIATLHVVMDSFRLAAGCFVFSTREAFAACGGFDERLYGAEEVAISQALKRHGRFVILRERVLTSGRKLRSYSGREVWASLSRLMAGGAPAFRSREALDLWYRPRREDPADEQIRRAA
jgi:glycosyltransferase involved in cell wall biosynthesis